MGLGYSFVEAEDYVSNFAKQPSSHLGPSALTDGHKGAHLAANRRYQRPKGFDADFALEVFASMLDRELPDSDGLKYFLFDYANGDCNDDNDDKTDVDFYWCIHDALKAAGRKRFDPYTWDKTLQRERNRAHERFTERAAAKARSERGRPSTDKSRMRDRVKAAIGCKSRRAYDILEEGTTSLAQRRALAAEFADDSDRNLPAQWEPKTGQRVLGRVMAKPFRDFALLDNDDFDDHTQARLVLADAYQRGVLPDHFERLEQLMTELKVVSITIDADDLLAIWRDFTVWRR